MSEPKKNKKDEKKRRKGPKRLPSRPQLTLVRLRKDYAAEYQGIFSVDDRLVFMGELRQMPGHCVLTRFGDGKYFAGYHSDVFEIIPKGE